MSSNSALINGHHIGVWCSDFESSRRFYIEGLGCKPGYFFNEMTAADDGTIFKTNPGCEYLEVQPGWYVELLPVSPKGAAAQNTPPRGLNHLAFRVADVDRAYERAQQAARPTHLVTASSSGMDVLGHSQ